MRTIPRLTHCVVLLVAAAALPAQDPAAGRQIGVILDVDAAGGRIRLKSDAGPEAAVRLNAATRFLQVAPGAKDLTGATPSAFPTSLPATAFSRAAAPRPAPLPRTSSS